MTFDRVEFSNTLKDIEKYIGILKGNELACEYLEDVRLELDKFAGKRSGIHAAVTFTDDYKFPCPDEEFQVYPLRGAWTPTLVIDPEDPNRLPPEYHVRAFQSLADEQFRQGKMWASGLAYYLESICAQFTKPDVPALSGALVAMQKDVVAELTNAPNDDYALLGSINTRWTGAAAASFNEFYGNYNDIIARAARYGHVVNLGILIASQVIAGTQAGAMEYVKAMRNGLKAQLHQWVRDGWTPREPVKAEFPEWVTDVLKIADKALGVAGDYVPAVGDFQDLKNKVKHIVDLGTTVMEVAGKDIPPKPARIAVSSSLEIYNALTNALIHEYAEKFTQGLDLVQAGGAGGGSLEEKAFSGAGVVRMMDADFADGSWRVPAIPKGRLTDDDDKY